MNSSQITNHTALDHSNLEPDFFTMAEEKKSESQSAKDIIKDNMGDPNFQYFSTCLRVKYAQKSVDYFVNNFEMVLLYKNNENGVSNYYLVSAKADTQYPAASSKEAQALLWSYDGGVLQLQYCDGDKENEKLKINNGNVEPFRGFGHIAFNTNDVYAVCAELEKNGVTFKKKPNEGRMKERFSICV